MRAEALAALFARASRPCGAILCYHSLVSESAPSESTANVTVEEFLRHVDAIRSVSEIVPLSALLERHRAGRSTAGLVALTFDDAYASLGPLQHVLFRARQLPITVFVSSDGASRGTPFWWDRVDDVFPHVTETRWRQFENEVGVPQSFRGGQPASFGPIRPLRQWILSAHQGRWTAELEPVLELLERDANFATVQRPMTFEELERLVSSDLVEVGVHTVSHPVLPLLPEDELHREIAACHAMLRERFPSTLPVLAFPYGLFDERAARLSHDAGMSFALSLGNRLLSSKLSGRVLPRLSMSRGLSAWKLLLHVSGVVEWLRGIDKKAPVSYPPLPSPST